MRRFAPGTGPQALLSALLAVVLAVACTAPPVTVSPTPPATVATATPTATAAATAMASAALLKSNFGVIYWGARSEWAPGSAPQILPEGRTAKVGELAGSYFNQFHGTVSPDGRRAIYPAQPAHLAPWAYYLVDGAKPGEQRRILEFPNEIPGPIRWSADMSAVVFTVQDAGATQGVRPKYDSIRTLDFSTGAVRELARITDGSSYTIVGWDKPSGTVAAQVKPYDNDGTTTPKQSRYLVIDPSGSRTTPIDGPSAWATSPDVRTVIGLQCARATGCGSLWTWPLADYSARVDQHLPAGLSVNIIGSRPGTSEFGLTVFEPNGSSGRLAVWSASGGLRTVYPFPVGRSPNGSSFFRADGSAVFIVFGSGEHVVVDVATGQSVRLPLSDSHTSYSRPAASIRLD